MIPDPRGRPSLSDQSPFSVRRRSIVTRRGIIMKPPGVFFFCHPGCRNGNESLKSGQRVAAWPILPHHVRPVPPERALFRRWPLSWRLPLPWRCPSRKERNICSSLVGTGGFTAPGCRCGGSLTHCCNSFSISDNSGFGAGRSVVEITRRSKSSGLISVR